MSNTTTRHSARCQTEGCNRFVPTGDVHCGACVSASRTAWSALQIERRDHASDFSKLDADLIERTKERDEQTQMANDLRAEVATLTAQLAERTQERDEATALVTDFDRENGRLREAYDYFREGAQGAIAQRDALTARLSSVNRRDWSLLAWAIVATIAAVAGWV